MPSKDLLATAGTLENLRQSIVRFYCGAEITLQPIAAGEWRVLNTASGAELRGVRVRQQGRRFRFEMTDVFRRGA